MKRDKHLDATVSEAEMELIRRAAEREGLTVAAWLRRLALKAARETSEP